MSHLDNYLFVPAPFFLARTPFFSIEEFYNLLKAENSSEYILSLFKERGELREAIAVASPTLYETLTRMVSKNDLKAKESDQAISSLFKYVLRMATRATPFGLFSYVSLGAWGEKSTSEIDLCKVKKRARPDMEWLIGIVDRHLTDPTVLASFFVKRNPLIYESMGRIVLPYSRKKDHQTKQVSIRLNPLIHLILEITDLPIAIPDLLEQILSKLPLDKDKVFGVIYSLIQQEILCPSFLPALLTSSPFADLVHHLSSTLPQTPLIPKLKDISALIKAYNETPIGGGEHALHLLIEGMKSSDSISSPIQVDMSSDQEITLPEPVRFELAKGIEALWHLSPLTKGVPALRSYHAKFLDKYGTFRIVPLLELLDDTVGLGIPKDYSNYSSDSTKETLWDQWLSEQWIQCIRDKQTEIVLTDEILQKFRHKEQVNAALSSFDVFFELIPHNKDDFIISLHALSNLAGGCATFGRFIDLLGTNAEEKIRAFFKDEESLNPNSLSAEISYFPSSPRSANVAIHPNLRTYKIDLGYGQSQDHTLRLEDIFVGATSSYLFLTLRDGMQRIIVDATNVLNSTSAPSVARFLRDVSKDYAHSFSFFSWGKLDNFNFLPSVRYGKTLLASAQWRLTYSLIGSSEKDTLETVIEKIKVWGKEWNLPRFVLMTWADHQILLDMTHPFHLREIAHRLKSDPKSATVLIEKRGEEEWVKSKQGQHRCEFVVPFLKNKAHSFIHDISTGFIPTTPASRWKMPGGEWFYAKIYLPKENEVRFLAFYLDAFIQSIKGKIEKWFFIRYAEGDDFHIRLRCKVGNEETLAYLFKQFHLWAKELMEKGWIRDTHLASYEREIERYGGEDVIDLAETFFEADSEAVITLLQTLSLKKIEFPDYVLASFSLIDLMLGFGISLQDQQSIYSKMDLQKDLLEGFREWKSKMGSALDFILYHKGDSALKNDSLSYIREIFGNRKEKQRLYAEALQNRTYPASILHSVLHMHCNRLLGVNHSLEQKAYLYSMKILSTLQLKQVQEIEKCSIVTM